MTLTEIENLAKKYSAAHDVLAGILNKLRDEQRTAERKVLPRLRDAVALAAQAKIELSAAIAGGRALFAKPRTQVFHGVKCGLQKLPPGIEFTDADRVVALIRQRYGKDAAAYIRTKESPDLKMLADMPDAELEKIGCARTPEGDAVVVKTTDSEIEKAVAALLESSVGTEDEV